MPRVRIQMTVTGRTARVSVAFTAPISRTGSAAQNAVRRAVAAWSHERQERPRQQCGRQRLRRQRPDHRDHPRRQRVDQRTEDRGVPGQPEPGRQQPQPQVGHGQEKPRPHGLGHPDWDARRVGDAEERTHREQVAVGLVLQLAEPGGRVPRRERTRQEPPRVDDEIELGVEAGAARILQQQHQQEDGEDDSIRHPGSSHRALTTVGVARVPGVVDGHHARSIR